MLWEKIWNKDKELSYIQGFFFHENSSINFRRKMKTLKAAHCVQSFSKVILTFGAYDKIQLHMNLCFNI